MTPKAQATMTKIESKTFGTINNIMKKIKRLTTEQKKKVTNHIPDKGLISKIHKGPLNSIIKR